MGEVFKKKSDPQICISEAISRSSMDGGWHESSHGNQSGGSWGVYVRDDGGSDLESGSGVQTIREIHEIEGEWNTYTRRDDWSHGGSEWVWRGVFEREKAEKESRLTLDVELGWLDKRMGADAICWCRALWRKNGFYVNGVIRKCSAALPPLA